MRPQLTVSLEAARANVDRLRIQSPFVKGVLLALTSAGALLLSGCDSDLSCVQTATCKPIYDESDAQSDAKSDASDAGSDTVRVDARTDWQPSDQRAQSDGATADQIGVDSARDAFADLGNGPDVSGRDVGGGDRVDGRAESDVSGGSGHDVATADGSGGQVDVSTGADATTGVDTRQDAPTTSDGGDALSPMDTGAADTCVRNDCGGCAPLSAQPGTSCGACGTYACNGEDAVACIDPGTNACGGCGALSNVPGTSCGACGKYVCSSGKDSVVCDHPDFLKVKQVEVASVSTCVLLDNGTVRCWGGAPSLLGDGSAGGRVSPPSSSIPGLDDIKAIAMGAGPHICALSNSGDVRCWGYESNGQLGDGAQMDRATPSRIVLSGATFITAGLAHTCALLSSKKVQCWGRNFYGELGDGLGSDRSTPGIDVADLDGVVAIAAGDYHTCALLDSGGVRCWGWNFSGQLGDGSNADRSTPSIPIAGLAGVTALSLGQAHSCAMLKNGTMRCWGWNGYGVLGDGSSMPRNTAGSDLTNLTAIRGIAAGYHHTCAIHSSGGVGCWGGYSYLGDGSTMNRLMPLQADIPGLTDVIAMRAAFHSCAVTSSGGMRCWGNNSDGQLGDGTKTERPTPVDVPGMCP